MLKPHFREQQAGGTKNSNRISSQVIPLLNSMPVYIGTCTYESAAELMPAFTFRRPIAERKYASFGVQNFSHEIYSKCTLIETRPNSKTIFDGSRVVENDYRAWIQTTGASSDSPLGQAWETIRSVGLADVPAPAAARYGDLAEAAVNVADNWNSDLSSTALGPLLDLASHARKHAIRLRATAEVQEIVEPSERDREVAALVERFETPEIAEIARQARSQEARTADANERSEIRRSRREARVHRYAPTRQRDR
jgi:hypothetical protein